MLCFWQGINTENAYYTMEKAAFECSSSIVLRKCVRRASNFLLKGLTICKSVLR